MTKHSFTYELMLGLGTLAFGAYVYAQPGDLAAGTPSVVYSSTETSAKLNGYTFEQRPEFSSVMADLRMKSDTAIADVKAGYNEMMASPVRRASMQALSLASTTFTDKISALDNASVDTWGTVKTDLVTAWGNLQRAIAKARDDKP